MALLQWMLALLTILAVEGLDPCVQYTLISDPHRAPSYNSTQLLCDRLLETKWYRFDKAEMPRTCVRPYHCGTHVPMWLQGDFPKTADGIVSRKACADLHPDDTDCCDFSIDISLMNCGVYMVYKLTRTPGCSMAYCAEKTEFCTADQYSVTGVRPCIDAYPKLTQAPFLSTPLIVSTDYVFRCMIPYPKSKTDATFEVTWLIDNKPIAGIPSVQIQSPTTSTMIQGAQLAGFMNHQLSCSVKTTWTDNRSGGRKSPPFNSNSYYMGVRLSQTNVSLTGGNTSSKVTLTSTVPIVCTTQGTNNCSVDFKIYTDNGHVSTDTCLLQLRPGRESATFTITEPPRIVLQPPSHTVINITGTGGQGTGSQWNLVTLPNVQVNKNTTKPSALCSLYGDPHIKTFDRKGRYTQHTLGKYIAVDVKKYSFKVETLNTHCGNAVCVCAVALREGNDVLIFDRCGRTVPTVDMKLRSLFSNQTKVVLSKDGKTYVVTFRSGAVVRMMLHPGSKILDVWVSIPGDFYGETEGLCGTYDGNGHNDLTSKDGRVHANSRLGSFVDSWRIADGESLFEHVQPLPTAAPEPKSCTCTFGTDSCSSVNTAARNETLKVLCPDCKEVTQKIATTVPTPRPAVTTSSSHVTPMPSSSTTPPSISGIVTSPPNAVKYIPRKNATMICNASLTSYPSFQYCITNQMGVDVSSIIQACVFDIVMTGETNMALASMTTMMQECSHAIITNPNATIDGAPPEAKLCPTACSGHGDCQDGVCVCSPGYEGSDCSINSLQPPAITGIPGGPCEIMDSTCYQPVVAGSNMKPSTDTKCLVHTVQKHSAQVDTKTDGVLTAAEFLSTEYVRCNIPTPDIGMHPPALTVFKIHVSNNGGQTESNGHNYVIYNSNCLTCDENNNCFIKAGTCKIENTCYMDGERSDFGACNPKVDPERWAPDGVTTKSVPPSVEVYQGLNHYTAAHTGCGCYFDSSRTDCACCRNIGCPCGSNNPHQCFDCLHPEMCKP